MGQSKGESKKEKVKSICWAAAFAFPQNENAPAKRIAGAFFTFLNPI
ncbi:MAG: hypothetical protein K9J37_20270 [Saprospiraceae bacterium]|nr:hypothetical protein [Saprospiraceae bacterium]MCF8252264.1 hypothetical protein [Saprospiraceae bacterium]MCF8283093.1 hypothetical protein [Bacteroidales bacterium]MCF8313907.1 hypothetical protein [Saprospiraceae bacterium]MCF8443137.1 hypothetical protein [Saprospiraceae bacterium]